MKTSKNLDRSTKKDRKVLPVAAQVYVQNSLNSATEIGRFKNAACTFMHVVADLFTPLPERTGKSRAAPWATMGGE